MLSPERREIFAELIKSDVNSVIALHPDKGGKKLLLCSRNILQILRNSGVCHQIASSPNAGEVTFAEFTDDEPDYQQYKSISFLLNPETSLLAPLVAQLHRAKSHTTNLSVHFTPQLPLLVEHVLEKEYNISNAIPSVKINSLDWDFFPLSQDLATMNLPTTFSDLYVNGDLAPLRWVARMLLKLQTSYFGLVQSIKGKGPYASKVVRILDSMQNEVGSDFTSELTSEVDSIIVLDRTLDLATPLMTQLTYEGLLVELFTVRGYEVEFPFSVNSEKNVHTIPLKESDKVLADIRDCTAATFGHVLHQKTLWVKQTYEHRKAVTQLRELNEYVRKLPEVQEVHRLTEIHTRIAMEMKKLTTGARFQRRIEAEQNIIQQVEQPATLEYIEDLIIRGESLTSVLRVACLFSVVNNGMKQKDYDTLKQSMMLSYGIPQIMSAFFLLERCGLLKVSSESSSGVDGADYATIRSKFRTWFPQVNQQHPTDCAYAYCGYASLLVRIIELIVAEPRGWNSTQSPLNLIPGEATEIRNSNATPAGSTKTKALVIIGGITAAEIASIRFLQTRLAQMGKPQNFLIITTDVTSGRQMISSVLPFREDGMD